jgi:tetratricopeptide (TPR) repeat protein
VLDDIHWADDATMLLLGFAVREIRRSHLLLVSTHRESELQHTPRHLTQIARADERLTLQGLDRPEVELLVAETTAGPVPAAVVEQLHRVSGGNPYFLGELVRLLRTQGGLPAMEPWRRLPEEVCELTRQRMAPLGPDNRRVLAVAATIGQEFDLPLLGAAAGLAPERLLERLTIAIRAGFVRESSHGLGRFEFVHALVRETLYRDLPPPRRAELHREIARALEAAHADAPARAPIVELAHHYFHAASLGETRKAVQYALAAGDRALASLGHEEAAGHYQRSLEMLEREQSDSALEVRAWLALGDAACRSGDNLRAQVAFQKAAAVAVTVGDAEAMALAAIGFHEARPHFGVAEPTLVRLLEDALAALGGEDSVLRARALAALAEALYGVPAEEQRRARVSREAVAMARRVGDRAALASALVARHFTREDSLDERLAMAAESGRIARELHDDRRSLDALAWLIGDLLELGDVAAVDRELESLARASDEIRMPFYRWVVTTTRASRALLAGRFADAARLAAEARAILPEGEPTSFAEQVYAVQMTIQNGEMDRMADSEAPLALLAGRIPEVPGWRCSLAALYADLGRAAEARSLLEQLAASDLADLPRDAGFTGALAMLARIVVALHDVPRARLVYDLLLPYADRSVVVGFGIACYGAAARYLGLLAATLGSSAEAARHFERALALNARMGARPFLAHTQREYGDFLLARGAPGDVARAASLRDEARRTADELGMERLRRMLAREGEAPSDTGDAAVAGVLRRAGDSWTITFAGASFRLADTKGIRYLATLLRHPGEEFHTLLLGAPPPEASPRASAAAGLRIGRARLAELRDDRAEAERFNDPDRVERAEREIEMLTQELARAVGLGGRARRAGSAAERARLNVTRAIAAVLRKITREHPVLGEHLAATVRTGTFCTYAPDPRSPVRWDV